MKTLVFKIHISDSQKNTISALQRDYSSSFRKMYSNIDLIKDPIFLSSLKIKSKKQIEYLQKEVVSFYDKELANKKRIQENIQQIKNKQYKNSTSLKQKLKQEKQKKKDLENIIRLTKSLSNKVVFGGRKNLIALSKGKGNLDEWQSSRLFPLIFYGETARAGNRFFDLEKISEGNILFKMESTKIKIPIKFNPKKHENSLIELQSLIINKSIPVTIKLTTDKLYITYDESILCGTNVDIKSFYKTISHVKDKENRKLLIRNKYLEHESFLKEDKLDRYLAIDLNPDGIGYCVLNKDYSVINKGYIDMSKLYKADKRKFETSMMIKELFKLIKHYRCHMIILEDLNFKSKDLGNKISNRKVNNLWNRNLIGQIISRRCNEEGILKFEVNPCYTSFIGNILHEEYDPIAASMEIGRRGINKYSKGGFYPELDVTNLINDGITTEMYDKIQGCATWKDLYSLFVTAKRSYRRKLNEFNFEGYWLGSRKSKVKHLVFP